MLKIILITVLLFYAIYRISGFLHRIFSGGLDTQNGARSNRDSNVRVDKNPNKHHRSYEGGEYVDYEEVKD